MQSLLDLVIDVKSVCLCGVAGFLVCMGSIRVQAQEVRTSFAQAVTQDQTAAELPDAPRPQIELAELVAAFEQPDGQQGSSSPSSAQQPDSTQQKQQKSEHDTAEEQLKEQETQRVAGVVPSFNISYRPDAVALSSAQKFNLAFHTAIDPVTFATAFLTGGYHEIFDGDRVLKPGSQTIYIRENGTGFEWGPKGYFERVGTGYLDAFDGTILGNAVFTSLFHQDPRFFRMGHGSFTRRLIYSASTSFICKGDKSRKWQPNISNVLGNIVGGEISNLYYPAGSPNAVWDDDLNGDDSDG